MAERHPDLLRRLLGAGMSVGVHTWDHLQLRGRDSDFVADQLLRTIDIIALAGGSPSLFRPPYGSWDSTTIAVAAALQLRTVIWSVNPRDWRRPGTEVITERVLSRARPGSIVLLHDGGGDRSQTVAALPRIVDGLQARGLSPVSID
jgi:peptidoglycan/xylan/chitin deacetylase (PgdA/CDA1 family)